MPLMTNKDRAERAQRAADAYSGTLDLLAPDELISDMICDLLHLAIEEKLDPKKIMCIAVSNFVGESLSAPDNFSLKISTFIDWED